MVSQDDYIAALIDVHAGVGREGPGDEALSQRILDGLPELPGDAPVADLGCGTGVASVMLAKYCARNVVAVDLSPDFLNALQARAANEGLANSITTMAADIGTLDPTHHQFSLIWSEGAAYNITFAGALNAWKPLLLPGGCAVISELSWFTTEPPAAVTEFWGNAYPTMGSEADNITRAQDAGFTVLTTERLPAEAWWRNYYTPLRRQLDQALADNPTPAMQAVAADIRQEIELFATHSDHYGYTFYVLQKPAAT